MSTSVSIVRSILCPQCGVGASWETDRWHKTATCTTCGHIRPFYPKNKWSSAFTEQTPSQERVVEDMLTYFANLSNGTPPYCETEMQRFGDLYLDIHTNLDERWRGEGGTFWIGRRGGVECLTVDGLHSEGMATFRKYRDGLREYGVNLRVTDIFHTAYNLITPPPKPTPDVYWQIKHNGVVRKDGNAPNRSAAIEHMRGLRPSLFAYTWEAAQAFEGWSAWTLANDGVWRKEILR